jgi:sigma-B regulation protein RsbU (phosphoserine phosphatase)
LLHSLRSRICLLIITILIVSIVITNVIAITSVIKHVNELTDNSSAFVLNIIKASINTEMMQDIGHPTKINKNLHRLFTKTLTPYDFILLVNKTGKSIVTPNIDFLAKNQREIIKNTIFLPLIRRLKREKKPFSIIKKIKTPKNKLIEWEFRIAKTIHPDHFVIHASQISKIRKPGRELIADLLIVNTLILIFGLIASLVLIKKLTDPLNSLTNHLKHLPEKKFKLSTQAKAEITNISRGKNDISLMAKAFIRLNSSLRKYIVNFKRSTAAKEHMLGELKAARKIQLGLLPENNTIDLIRHKIDVHALLKPAHQVGGDFYDFGLMNNKYFYFIVGDVSDKSIASAIFMAITKTLLGSEIKTNISPGEILTKVNYDLLSRNKANMFVTMFLGIINLETGEIKYTNAGHPPPILLRNNESAKFLTTKTQPVIGVMQNIKYITNTTALSKNELLFIYSDGVTDAKNKNNELFADNRLLDFINKNGTLKPIKALTNLLLIQLAHFMKYEPQSDDITVLAIRYEEPSKNDLHKLSLPAEIDSITKFHNFILDKTKSNLKIQKNIHNIYLAAEEAIINIIKHAYPPDEKGLITLSLDLTPADCLIIKIEDQGKPFDPTKTKPLQLDNDIDKLSIGGIGCHLMQQLTDGMSYKYADNKNILTLKFKIG